MEYTIFDYIEYYKDYSFVEKKFNMMDALIYSIISYVPVDNLRENSSLKALNNITSNIKGTGTMSNLAIDVIGRICNSTRYKNVRLYSLVKEYNDQIEFGAITFRDYNYTFIGFQGSIGTISGWKENLYIALDFPTLSQDRSAKYIKDVIRFTDRHIYIGGHSKGGNLALASLLLIPKRLSKRVVKVYNFDGPGFKDEELASDKFKLLQNKMVNILPDGSMVGILLNHNTYNFVRSKSVSIDKHFPNNWIVFGEFFVKTEENKSSKALNNKIDSGLSKLSYEERKIFIDTLFELIKNKKITSLKDFSKLDIDDIKGIISNMKNLSSDKKKMLLDTAKTFLKNN
jgi:hypothetical protein